MSDYASSLRIGLGTLEHLGLLLVTSTSANPKEEDSRIGIRLSQKAMREGCFFPVFFPHVLEIAQPDFTRKDSTADGTIRTLSRIDRAFINLPVAEARDFQCYSYVFENLGERSILCGRKPILN